MARRHLAIPVALVEIPPELMQQGLAEIERSRGEVAKINNAAQRDLPRHKYAAPFDDKDKRPRIAVLITGLGLQYQLTQQMLQALPHAVTLGFSSYGRQIKEWLEFARSQQREVVLSLPLQTAINPNAAKSPDSQTLLDQDAGPFALGVELTLKQNLSRLDWLLERGEGAVGLMPNGNEAFWQAGEVASTVLNSLRERGYLLATPTLSLVQSALSAGVPTATLSVAVDQPIDNAALTAQLQRLEGTAKTQGAAAISLPAYPALLPPLTAWLAKLNERGFVLAPLSAVTEDRSSTSHASPSTPPASPPESTPPAPSPASAKPAAAPTRKAH